MKISITWYSRQKIPNVICKRSCYQMSGLSTYSCYLYIYIHIHTLFFSWLSVHGKTPYFSIPLIKTIFGGMNIHWIPSEILGFTRIPGDPPPPYAGGGPKRLSKGRQWAGGCSAPPRWDGRYYRVYIEIYRKRCGKPTDNSRRIVYKWLMFHICVNLPWGSHWNFGRVSDPSMFRQNIVRKVTRSTRSSLFVSMIWWIVSGWLLHFQLKNIGVFKKLEITKLDIGRWKFRWMLPRSFEAEWVKQRKRSRCRS